MPSAAEVPLFVGRRVSATAAFPKPHVTVRGLRWLPPALALVVLCKSCSPLTAVLPAPCRGT